MEKVIRDGKVAVLYSPGFGAGWSTWMDGKMAQIALYHPAFVEAVEAGGFTEMEAEKIAKRLGADESFYGGGDQLKIEWLPEGTQFLVNEYDGSESIQTSEGTDWNTA